MMRPALVLATVYTPDGPDYMLRPSGAGAWQPCDPDDLGDTAFLWQHCEQRFLLGCDRDGTPPPRVEFVAPPYFGNARVVLEGGTRDGSPGFLATIYHGDNDEQA